MVSSHPHADISALLRCAFPEGQNTARATRFLDRAPHGAALRANCRRYARPILLMFGTLWFCTGARVDATSGRAAFATVLPRAVPPSGGLTDGYRAIATYATVATQEGNP